MRKLLIRVFGTALSFYITAKLVGGFLLEPSWLTYLMASLVFVLVNWVVSPIVKLLLLPINLLTLGLFRWVASIIVLYVFDLLYGGVTIQAYQFPGFQSGILAIPPGNVSLFWTLVLSSLTISLSYSLVSTLLLGENS